MASVVAAPRRVGTIAAGLLRSINRHRWAAGLVAFCVVVLSASIAGFVVYRPEIFPESWPPEYQEMTPLESGACPDTAGCLDVYTNADDEKSLTYVTKEVASGSSCTVINFRDQDDNGEIFAMGAYIDGRAYVDSTELHIESPYSRQGYPC